MGEQVRALKGGLVYRMLEVAPEDLAKMRHGEEALGYVLRGLPVYRARMPAGGIETYPKPGRGVVVEEGEA